MKATLLLCDWAQVIQGKLYAQGIGWTQTTANQPTSMAVALVVRVDYNETNIRHKLEVRLVDDDGHDIIVQGNPVRAGYEFEIGRPPGMTPGETQMVTLAGIINGIALEPGRYSWDLYYNDNKIPENVSFTAK